MKYLFALHIIFFLGIQAHSQHRHFIYIQTEDRQPFFVRMGDSVQSSSSAGYIILSGLSDSVYQFAIGFPGNRQTDLRFSVPVNHKDQGFLLRKFPDKGWGLFDLQTLAVNMSASVKDALLDYDNAIQNDRFTSLLSRAANDPDLLYPQIMPTVKRETGSLASRPTPEPAIITETVADTAEIVVNLDIKETENEPEEETRQEEEIAAKKPAESLARDTIVKTGTAVISVATPVEKKQEPAVMEERTDPGLEEKEMVVKKETTEPPEKKEAYRRSRVERKSESSTTEGFGMVFLDHLEGGATDTIRILIPPDHFGVALQQPGESEKKSTASETVKSNEPRFLEIEEDEKKTQQPTVAKNNCTEAATEKEFLKLRRKMAMQSTEDRMISEAEKVFKTTCFETEQIRLLGTLFLTNGGKYRFFDAAYAHVTDPEKFSSLEVQIKDEYFLNRFRAMLRR